MRTDLWCEVSVEGRGSRACELERVVEAGVGNGGRQG